MNYRESFVNTAYDIVVKNGAELPFATLWNAVCEELGLSEEDRRIAKEERMTPAEFIEAEEYDDDELLKDEWER